MFIVPAYQPHTMAIFSVNCCVVPLYLLDVVGLHWGHQMEFLCTPFLHSEQGHFLDSRSEISSQTLVEFQLWEQGHWHRVDLKGYQS